MTHQEPGDLIARLRAFLSVMDEFGASNQDDAEIVSGAHAPASLTLGDIRLLLSTLEAQQARIAVLEGALEQSNRLNNKYAWERDKAREERDTAERRSEAFWKDRARTDEGSRT